MIAITNPKKFSAILLVSVIVIGAIIFRLVWGSGVVLKSGDVEIAQGESGSQIWRNLVKNGYADRTIPWKWYGRSGNAEKIQAGIYHVEKGETAYMVIHRFIAGDVNQKEVAITFPEGFTIMQIGQRLEQRGIGTAKEFIAGAIVKNYSEKFLFLQPLSPNRSLEGYLFPDTYRIAKDDTAHDVIMKMLGNFDMKTRSMRETLASNPKSRTLDQLIILASILEKEVRSEDDMALVAGVLWKRLENNEGLYVDATIEYVVEKNGALTVQDLALDSPYNTRKYRGLPPTAIGNPGLMAIRAADNPRTSDYYYYLTTSDGTTVFAKTNDEHNANKVKYLK